MKVAAFALAIVCLYSCGRDNTIVVLVSDNGVGIAHGNLERVFDQGFSTKSRDTNYGIGLHWCANAISAMGGRIWAVSDGPGRGASMHLMLPLTIRPTPLSL